MLDGVTLNQLRTFVAVCDAASFSAAAKTLRRAQSAVSHAIAALEAALDVTLFERDAGRATLSAAGQRLLPDARAVIARTEEMKTRARTIVAGGAPQISLAVDVYFPRERLLAGLQSLQRDAPTAGVDLRMTTMQAGEALVLAGVCALAITVAEVPELEPGAIERHWLCDTAMVTVCAPSHPLAATPGPVPVDEFTRHVQIVAVDHRSGAEPPQAASDRRWLVDDLGAKHDFIRAGLGWGHMPADRVAADIASGTLVAIPRRAWRLRPLTFMLSHRRGHCPSACEAQLVGLLADRGAAAERPGLPHRAEIR